MSKVFSTVNAESELERSNYRRTILRNPGRARSRYIVVIAQRDGAASFSIIRLFFPALLFFLSSTRPFTRHSTFVRSQSCIT